MEDHTYYLAKTRGKIKSAGYSGHYRYSETFNNTGPHRLKWNQILEAAITHDYLIG